MSPMEVWMIALGGPAGVAGFAAVALFAVDEVALLCVVDVLGVVEV